MLVLLVIQGPDKGKKYELPDHEPQLIGRSSEALPLSDTTVSRRHAELTPDQGAWYIRDLSSQNGTFVNAVKISDRIRLRPGDQIRTGATLFVFGSTESTDPDVIRVLSPGKIDASIERTLRSNEDSILLAEPAEPRLSAADHLRVIYRLTALLGRGFDRNELLRQVMDLVFSEFKPERGFIVTRGSGTDEQPQTAVVKYANAPATPDEAKIHVSRTILQNVLKNGDGVLSSNAMTDPRFAKGDSVQRGQVRSAVCSPIRFKDRSFGAIYIDSSVANYAFTPEQLALLNAIGQHTGLAMSNAELYAHQLQSERLAAVGETVASLSHSIKNILQGLRGGADVVEMGLKRDDLKVAKGGWGILKRNLDRIVGLTLNMLAFSRQRQIEPQLMHVSSLIEECVQLAEGIATTKSVTLISDIEPGILPILLDPNLIHQVLMNLLTNALEAVPAEGGRVTVRALAAAHPSWPDAAPVQTTGGVEIHVIDNGPGVPDAKMQWIFEPFNTTKGTKGTGLGLAVAKRITEEHGGRLGLESAPGQGATFKVFLPAEGPGTVDPGATTGEGPQSGRGL